MEYDYTCLNHNSLVSQKKVFIKGLIIKGVYYVLKSVTQPLAYAKNGDQQFWKEKFHGAKGKVQHTLMMCFGFFLLVLGWGELFFCQNMQPISTLAINPSYYGDKQLWKSKFHACS
jgi:hypothetical protein